MRRSAITASRQIRHYSPPSHPPILIQMPQRLPHLKRICIPCRVSIELHLHPTSSQQAARLKALRLFSTTSTYQFTTAATHRHAESTTHNTHYDFFPDTLPHGPPPDGRFHIDLRELRNEFLKLQATAHPDRHPGNMKARAEALSSRINEAYKTLKEPLPRAQYILTLNGVDVEDEAGKVEDMDLLALVMEAREEIEDAQNEKELQGLRQENDRRLDGSVRKLGALLEGGQWNDARAEAVRLRYWVNVKESIEAWKPGEGVPNLIH